MKKSPIATPIIQQPKVRIAADVMKQIETEASTHRQVIVHCEYNSPVPDFCIRIWPTTFLRDRDSDFKSKLITAYNITFYPEYLWFYGRSRAFFTLVFGGLPSSCTAFDLLEDIPEPSGFASGIIHRNQEDVYHARIHLL